MLLGRLRLRVAYAAPAAARRAHAPPLRKLHLRASGSQPQPGAVFARAVRLAAPTLRHQGVATEWTVSLLVRATTAPSLRPYGTAADDKDKVKGEEELAKAKVEETPVDKSEGKSEAEKQTEKESKVERVIRHVQEAKEDELGNLNFSTLVEPESTQAAAAEKPKAPLVKRMFTKDFWKENWKHLKEELHHYKMGFKLLWADIRISSKLLWRIMKGSELTRRERRQFVRTVSDLFRLVPFSVFIIVPGMELLLPFAIKIFPGMLPSQFQQAKTREDNIKAQLVVKLEMAKFLQQTIGDMAVSRTDSRQASEQVRSFAKLLEEGRKAGAEHIPTSELLKYSRVFEDELTLDNLSRAQLVALCRLLLLQPIGTNNFLRFQLRMKLRQLHNDDLMIVQEGVDSLSVQELQTACRERGMRAVGVTVPKMRERLQQWLDMHVKERVPASLLLLTRGLYLPEDVPQATRIRAAVEALPDAIKEEAKISLLEAEGVAVDPETLLKALKQQEALIEEERAEKERKEAERKEAERKEAERLEEERKKEEELREASGAVDAATAETAAEPEATPSKSSAAPAEEPMLDVAPKVESPESIAREQLASASPVSSEKTRITLEDLIDLSVAVLRAEDTKSDRDELATLKESLAEYKEDLEELAKADDRIQAPVGSIRLSKRVEKMVANLESNLDELYKEAEPDIVKLDLDGDGIITTEELIIALKAMHKPPADEKLDIIAKTLDSDSDGVLRMDVLRKVMTLIASEGSDISPETLNVLVALVEQEEQSKAKKKQAAAASAAAEAAASASSSTSSSSAPGKTASPPTK